MEHKRNEGYVIVSINYIVIDNILKCPLKPVHVVNINVNKACASLIQGGYFCVANVHEYEVLLAHLKQRVMWESVVIPVTFEF